MFSDGSLIEGGNVGGGVYIVGMDRQEQEVGIRIGDVATVWDGKIAGMAGGLSRTRTMQQKKVLIVTAAEVRWPLTYYLILIVFGT